MESGGPTESPPARAWSLSRITGRDIEEIRASMRRLVAVLTVVAVGFLLWISADIAWFAWEAGDADPVLLGVLLGGAWLAVFGVSVWFVSPAWSGTCLLAVSGALTALAGVLHDSVTADSAELHLRDLSDLATLLRLAVVCAFGNLLVWAAWSSVPRVRSRSATWVRIAVGAGVAALLVTAWQLVPDLPAYVD